MSRILWCVSAVLAGGLGCLPVNSVRWARDPLPDDAVCLVAVNNVAVTEQSRRACVAMAQVVEPDLPDLSGDALRLGPPSSHPFGADEDVWCRYVPREEDGGSLKFRCMRTDAGNRLYDEDGHLVTEPASFDDDGVLLNTEGQPFLDENGKERKGDELRVKYFLGEYPEARYREMFTETVVSHLFWALGIPVDRVYMPASVRCFGCGPDPFTQAEPLPAREASVFRFASVERRYDGKQINVDRRRGWMGLGGGYGHGFAFGELEGLAQSGSRERRAEIEVMVTALNIVGYNSPSSYQNELLCRADKWDRDTGVCTEAVAYVQDVGGTLGGEKARTLPGVPESEMKNHPRGDWPTFSQERVFSEPARCRFTYDLGIEALTEAGREAIDRRIRGRIGMEELLAILEKARIHRMDPRITALARARSGLPPGPELDRYVRRMWAEAIDSRLREVLDARCPT